MNLAFRGSGVPGMTKVFGFVSSAAACVLITTIAARCCSPCATATISIGESATTGFQHYKPSFFPINLKTMNRKNFLRGLLTLPFAGLILKGKANDHYDGARVPALLADEQGLIPVFNLENLRARGIELIKDVVLKDYPGIYIESSWYMDRHTIRGTRVDKSVVVATTQKIVGQSLLTVEYENWKLFQKTGRKLHLDTWMR